MRIEGAGGSRAAPTDWVWVEWKEGGFETCPYRECVR